MLLHHSRAETRVDADGALVTLEEQDRSRWDRAAIAEGVALVQQALPGGAPGPYALQAAIAALHARAPTAADTDWAQIAALYRVLHAFVPTPVIALNRAVAVAFSQGLAVGLRHVDELARDLDEFLPFHAARADLLRRLGRLRDAATAYRRAIK